MHLIVQFLLLISSLTLINGALVTIDDGPVNGTVLTTKKGRKFDAFMGIPFAKPPVDELRFEPPVPPEPWSTPLDATQIHVVCPQLSAFSADSPAIGVEDCLYLNVYTPNLNTSNELLPVMVWFHGGAWRSGTGNTLFYPPTYLLDKDIVLVSVNYRLGPLGFLSTEDLLVPGNNGLKDQTSALKWVQKNIAAFGGDPNSVTIFGESAGSASVHLLTLSPATEGLFNKAIAESGTAMALWAVGVRGESLEKAQALASMFNCPSSGNEAMIACLKTVDAREIVQKSSSFLTWDYDLAIPFKPVLEPAHSGAFLTEHPIDIVRGGKARPIPLITGVNTQEGAMLAAPLLANQGVLDDLNSNFNTFVPGTLSYNLTSSDVDFVSEQIRTYYFGDGAIDNSSLKGITDLYTDGMFLAGADQTVSLHTNFIQSPIFYYLFGYRGVGSFTDILGFQEDFGVCHADELQYLFPIGDLYWPHKDPTEDDLRMVEIMTSMWSNFAKTGNPTPDGSDLSPWLPVQSSSIEYYSISGPDNITMSAGLLSERSEFWRTLPLRT